ncbi:MAG: DUF1801 domain-containing protein [Propionibacteriaceae bacterium]|nr:DUF1801 domain-containing protein [Propionibacteriaceae bacterium]
MSVIDEYLADFSGEHRKLMDEIRALIVAAAPEATEALSWAMPTYKLNGNLVHFAAGKHHVGLYPGADGVSNFVPELDALGLKHSKGAIQFPLEKPLPRDLITRIVEFRVEQQKAKKK